MYCSLLLLVLALVPDLEAANLLHNGGFDQQGGWDCWNFHCDLTTNKQQGSHAWQVTGRHHAYEGPSQYVALKQNTRYVVDAYIKLLNNPTHQLFQHVKLTIQFTKSSDNSAHYVPVAEIPDGQPNQWIHMRGYFQTPNYGFKSSRLYFDNVNPSTNYIVDTASLTEIPENQNWKSDSDSNIDRYRKQDLHVQVSVAHADASQVQIEVIQNKHYFPFGTTVSANTFLHGDHRYRDYIYKHFNWAVIENALKWRQMEPHRGQIDYGRPLSTIKALKAHGIKVRGHCILWSVDNYVQDWVKKLSGNSLKQAVTTRIHGVVNATRGLVEHWDVNNENLHGWFYQQHTGDFDYILDVYRQAHQTNPQVTLFANDYSVVAQGSLTQAYLNHVMRIKNANVGLGGVGVQAHFSSCPDPTLVKMRLDVMAQAGLPIFVTELDINIADENKRADCYEKAMRVFFGHPGVKGILIWGFWSERHWRPNAALVSGSSFRQNAAGDRFMGLIEKEWHTYQKRTLSQGGDFHVRAFQGDYTIKVSYHGRVLAQRNVTLHGSPQTVKINTST